MMMMMMMIVLMMSDEYDDDDDSDDDDGSWAFNNVECDGRANMEPLRKDQYVEAKLPTFPTYLPTTYNASISTTKSINQSII